MASRAVPKAAFLKPRMIWWKGLRKTPVVDGDKLAAGNTIRGPAIVETTDTTVVVHPGTTLRVDALDNFEITFK
jgi:N-methylhydantoinase A/oxoprolinase/acetone carboxylase beta subunit